MPEEPNDVGKKRRMTACACRFGAASDKSRQNKPKRAVVTRRPARYIDTLFDTSAIGKYNLRSPHSAPPYKSDSAIGVVRRLLLDSRRCDLPVLQTQIFAS